ncbi:FAD-dependent oxidoreductase [Wolinella succinogenes]|uniref:FORMATE DEHYDROGENASE, BETA SUBUNIT (FORMATEDEHYDROGENASE [NADP+]) n=1 Tax=Wolinella succinogenes (strain ATCC 29543 / DSM 1740 / CCUG 13145 / JCM 31913 / LMG 7466 / NCTC 11488 / FDC 602W) TaxID=273121 RepID=Q7MBG7_WOLSU|nr:FAD-dependent oxidoreductase [Wolinella succinogenes]CAE09617.1 FORMATE DEHYDROGENASE, BETA SUBUNIT (FORMATEDEHYDROGENASE [NADP+]) [Wolinella succinogenes]VEG81832.1 Glutamate synthase [NADPH] small chain [Wolinella succinogenes]HCZ18266.1 formate dehydrogenase [Helicobacter sp.]
MSQAHFSSWRGHQEFLAPHLIEGRAVRAFIGWAGVMIYDPTLDVIALAKEYARQYQCFAETCGRCAPGKFGGKILFDLLEKIDQGRGEESDLERLVEVGKLMMTTSKCEVGKTTPLPILDLLEAYRPLFVEALGNRSRKERSKKERYIAKITAPCIDACPAHVDIPAYIEGVRDHLLGDSLAATRKSMPLAQVCGRVCPHPCESACRRGDLDEPISIMELKRLGADYEKERHGGFIHPYPPKPRRKDKRVAIIGAGPAGLSSAYYLALEGIMSDVFEALPVLGGEVSVGVPEYRMPIDRYYHDIEAIKSLGVSFWTNHFVSAKELDEMRQKYDAIILATGARISKKLGVKGEEESLGGYAPAIPWLDQINLATKFNLAALPDLRGKSVVCVGGGFTSMDVVRCAVRLGAKRIVMLYRRDEATLIQNTSKEEYHEALEEGVEFLFQCAVQEIKSCGGEIKALLVEEYEVVYEEGARKPSLRRIEREPLFLECDLLIPAVSQEVDRSFIPKEWNLESTSWGSFKTNGKDFSTTLRGVFAAGDCEKGPLTIVNAVGQGKRAASVVSRFLEDGEITLTPEEEMEDWLKKEGVYDRSMPVVGWLAGLVRQESHKEEPLKRREDFREVNQGLSMQEAFAESERCMRCYYISMVAL